jgi:hypothetical protein
VVVVSMPALSVITVLTVVHAEAPDFLNWRATTRGRSGQRCLGTYLGLAPYVLSPGSPSVAVKINIAMEPMTGIRPISSHHPERPVSRSRRTLTARDGRRIGAKREQAAQVIESHGPIDDEQREGDQHVDQTKRPILGTARPPGEDGVHRHGRRHPHLPRHRRP